ncbi:hypothetical protein, partial [Magnetococcus sp. PR-3]|uniref:hypothetical protein n=1 Tax=Magnetococcus sp. PR-3 TaxID=3120355 RepID=UPI002FCE563C
LWLFKASTDVEQWNIRVEVKAQQLAIDGYSKVKERLLHVLGALECRVIKESIGRFDLAVDVKTAEDFVPDPFMIVRHSRTKVMTNYAPMPEDEAVIVGAQEVTGITVGKMPHRQVQIYDKRREVKEKNNGHWYEIWGEKIGTCPRIWRTEFRFGKRALKEQWNVSTFEQLEDAVPSMLDNCMAEIRYLKEKNPENITRSIVHDMWNLIRESVTSGSFMDGLGKVGGVIKGKIVKGFRREFKERMNAQIMGMCGSWAVACGLRIKEAKNKVPLYLYRMGKEAVSQGGVERLEKSMKRATKRLFLIDDYMGNERECENASAA